MKKPYYHKELGDLWLHGRNAQYDGVTEFHCGSCGRSLSLNYVTRSDECINTLLAIKCINTVCDQYGKEFTQTDLDPDGAISGLGSMSAVVPLKY